MFKPKTEIYDALNALGYDCSQSNQDKITTAPAITFRIDNNSVDLGLDNQIASQDIVATVDIWADDSITASNIQVEAEAAMRSIGYRMTYSADVPRPAGTLFHIQCRFEALK